MSHFRKDYKRPIFQLMSNIVFFLKRPKFWKLRCKSYQDNYLLSYFRVYYYFSALMAQTAHHVIKVSDKNLFQGQLLVMPRFAYISRKSFV